MAVKAKNKNGRLFKQKSNYPSFYTTWKDMVGFKIKRFRLWESIYMSLKLMQGLKIQDG